MRSATGILFLELVPGIKREIKPGIYAPEINFLKMFRKRTNSTSTKKIWSLEKEKINPQYKIQKSRGQVNQNQKIRTNHEVEIDEVVTCVELVEGTSSNATSTNTATRTSISELQLFGRLQFNLVESRRSSRIQQQNLEDPGR